LKSPEIVRTRDTLRQALGGARAQGFTVGFVPTMGALHRGHLRLVEEARRRCHYTVVSIFVNPTQFGPGEDLARYPRDLDGDVAKCGGAGVDLVFAPEVIEIYPPGDATRVRVGGLGDNLCGPFRPGHFEGVATVVAKLFALVSPCTAIFGRKDYQQLQIVERMANDLAFAVTVVGMPTERDSDGLALSSRNAYLSPDERSQARSIPRALSGAWSAFQGGERRAGVLRHLVLNHVDKVATSIDYVSLADPTNLELIGDDATLPARALLALALRIGKTRLIDNVVLGDDPQISAGAS
jgi:pantoate--beta-alanine ligase